MVFYIKQIRMKLKKNTVVTIVGLLILIVGFLFLASPYTIIIALPVFVLGLLIILTTKQSITFKVLCIVLPIILFVPYTKLVFYIHKMNQGPETKIDLIIEEGFVGKIVVVNNLDCPISHEFNKRTKVIVPNNGITHYPGKPKINNYFTRVIEKSKNGSTKELNWHNLPNGEKGVILEGRSGVVVEGRSFEFNVIEIGNGSPTEFGIASLEDKIVQYIKNCETNR